MGAYSQEQEKPSGNQRDIQEISIARGYSLTLFGEETVVLNVSVGGYPDSSREHPDKGPVVASNQKRLPGLELAGLKIFN